MNRQAGRETGSLLFVRARNRAISEKLRQPSLCRPRFFFTGLNAYHAAARGLFCKPAELGFVPRAFLHRRDKEREGGHDIGKLLPSFCFPSSRNVRRVSLVRSTSPSFLPSFRLLQRRRRLFIFGAECSRTQFVAPPRSASSYEERTTFPAFRPISQLLFRVTGHFIQICPAFLRSGKFFSCTVQVKGGRVRAGESRVTTRNPFSVAAVEPFLFPLVRPSPLSRRFVCEGGKPTCRAAGVVRDFGRKKSRAKKV